MIDPIYQKIYSVVRKIPRGRVATYGQVAKIAGVGNQPRRVGYALGILEEDDVPWHRVVNAKGEISPRWDPDAPDRQKSLLLEEGIEFDKGRIELAKFQWKVNHKPQATNHKQFPNSKDPIIKTF